MGINKPTNIFIYIFTNRDREKAGCILTFNNYDYEEAYNKQIELLEEFELERLIKENKVPCLYRTTTTIAGEQLEADIYPSFYRKSDIPKTKRKEKQNLHKKIQMIAGQRDILII